MKLRHILKTAAHDITINADLAITPQSFATYTEERADGVAHTAVGWRLRTSADEGKYKGHEFELLVEPNEIDALIHALTVAKERFKSPDIPNGETVTG